MIQIPGKSIDWLDAWYESYRTRANVKIVKKAFACLLNFENYREMRKQIGSADDKINMRIIDKTVSDSDNEHLKYSFEVAKFSQSNDKTILDCLRFLSRIGEIAEQDAVDYSRSGIKSLTISGADAVRAVISQAGDLNLSLSSIEKKVIREKYFKYIQSSFYSSIIGNESEIYEISNEAFSDLLSNTASDISEGIIILKDKHYSRFVFGRAVKDGLTTINEVGELVASSVNREDFLFQSEIIMGIAKAANNGDIYLNTAVWIGDSNIAKDKECIDFYHKHCRLYDINTLSDSSGFDNYSILRSRMSSERREPDLTNILTSESLLAPPVLASYLLFNIASADFKIERFYAILYVIQKMPVLIPFIKKLESLHKIMQTRKYCDSDLSNNLCANFLLLSNVSLLSSEPQRYFDFLEKLYQCGRYSLIIAEASRMIKITKLKLPQTKLDRLVYLAVEKISEAELSEIKEKQVRAAYLLLLKGGYKLEKLIPYIDASMLTVISALEDKVIINMLEESPKGIMKELTTPKVKLLQVRGDYRRAGSNNLDFHFDCFIKVVGLSGAILDVEKVSRKIEGNDMALIRVNRGFAEVVSSDTNSHLARALRSLNINGHIPIDFVPFSIYLAENNLYSSKWINGHNKCAFKDGTLVVRLSDDSSNLIETCYSNKPEKVIFIHENYTYQESMHHRTPQAVFSDFTVFTVSGIKPEFYDALLTYERTLNNLQLHSFESQNPFEDEIKHHLPKFYYFGQVMNEDGVDYSA